MATNLHITQPGHRCINPLRGKINGAYIRAGEIVQVGNFQLDYTPHLEGRGHYTVQPANGTPEFHKPNQAWEFTNFNCAAAKLAELGRYGK